MKGADFRAAYRKALSEQAKARRNQRGSRQPKHTDEDPFDARVRAMRRRFRGT